MSNEVSSDQLRLAKRRNERIQLRKRLPDVLRGIGVDPDGRLSEDFEDELHFIDLLTHQLGLDQELGQPCWIAFDELTPSEVETLIGQLGDVWSSCTLRVVLSHWLPAGFLSFEGNELPRFALSLVELDGDTIYVGTEDAGRFALLDLYEETGVWSHHLRVDRRTALELGWVR